MAQYILGNDVTVFGSVLRRGRKVDDDFDDIPALQRAGAVLLPVTVGLEARALEVQVQASKGLNQTEQDTLVATESELGAGGGGVSTVTGSPPITSSGGANPAIGITAATSLAAGSLSAADKAKLNGIAPGATNSPLTSFAPEDVDKSAALVGSGTTAARADHKHDVSTAPPVTVGTANAEGTAVSLSRSDHVHSHGNQAGGALHADATISTAGFMSAADKVALNNSATLTSMAPEDVDKSAAVIGVSTDAARSDHKHDVSTAAPIAVGTSNIEGSATSLARSDHTHDHGAQTSGTLHAVATVSVAGFMSAMDKTKLDGVASGATNTPLASAPPTTILPDDAASVGVGLNAAREDHVHGIAAGVAGSIAIGDSAAEGISTSFARADHTHGLAAPAAPANVTKAAASAGASTNVARADHKHDVTTASAVAVGLANAEGASTSLARADHVHAGNGAVLAFGSSSVQSTTATRYLHPMYEASIAPTAPIAFEVPFAGTLRNLRLRHNTTAGNGNAIGYTVRVNGSTTALTVSLASTSTSGSDVVNTVTVAAGDRVDIEVTKAASVGTSPSDIMATFELAPL